MNFLPQMVLVASLSGQAGSGFHPRADLSEGHYLKVLAESEALLARNPKDTQALAARSQALSSQMRFAEAAELAQRALDLDPALADAFLARGLARAGTAVQLRNFGSFRQISGAMDDLRKATELDRTLQTAWMTLGVAYQQLPGFLGGSTRKALACADSLERIAPARGAALRGTILSLDGKWRESEALFTTALTLSPTDPQIVIGYLEALADKAARKSLGEQPQKNRLAVEARRLLPAMRTSGRGMEAICGSLLDADLPDEAWAAAVEGLRHVDAPSLLRLMLGKVAARSGLHRKEGLAYLDQVVKEPLEGGSGGYPSAHWRRGQILKDLGRTAESRQAAWSALALDSRHPGARKLLEELDR